MIRKMFNAYITWMHGPTPVELDHNALFKYTFLFNVFGLASLISLAMCFLRLREHPWLALIDFSIFLIAVSLLKLLRQHRQLLEPIASVALVCSFIQFFLIYFIAVENQTRSALLLIVLAAAFYLKGKRYGYYTLLATFAVMLGNHVFGWVETGYSTLDITTLCFYLIAQFFVIYSYERQREAHTRHLQGLNNSLEQQIRTRTEELAAANHALILEKSNLKHLSDTDHLTGLNNRYKFESCFQQEHSVQGVAAQHSALILIDIDAFKSINDQQGHLTGDQVIKTIAQTIKHNVRTSDIAARWGGDEFIIYAPRTNMTQAVHLAEKIRNQIASLSFDSIGQLSISAGVTEFILGDTLNSMLQRADLAMYQAKSKGKNQVQASVVPLV